MSITISVGGSCPGILGVIALVLCLFDLYPSFKNHYYWQVDFNVSNLSLGKNINMFLRTYTWECYVC